MAKKWRSSARLVLTATHQPLERPQPRSRWHTHRVRHHDGRRDEKIRHDGQWLVSDHIERGWVLVREGEGGVEAGDIQPAVVQNKIWICTHHQGWGWDVMSKCRVIFVYVQLCGKAAMQILWRKASQKNNISISVLAQLCFERSFVVCASAALMRSDITPQTKHCGIFYKSDQECKYIMPRHTDTWNFRNYSWLSVQSYWEG